MKIEEFRNEVGNEPIEACEEAAALVEELGLTGQVEIGADQAETRLEYSPMTKTQRFVWEAAFPEHQKLEDFSGEAIPLRVLRTIKAEQDQFDFFEVWHNYTMPDPLLVGWRGDNRYSGVPHPICRWGAELVSWSEMVAVSIESWRERRRAKAHGLISLLRAELEAIEHVTSEDVASRSSSLSLHGHLS